MTRGIDELLRILDNGDFITHEEMAYVAQLLRYQRELQRQALRCLQLGSELDIPKAIELLKTEAL
jgi:predicted amidohydrolase